MKSTGFEDTQAGQGNHAKALGDIWFGVSNARLWLALGWNDVLGRYNRSKLGPLWAGLSIFIFVTVLGPIYSSIMNTELSKYMMHLLLGFSMWSFLSQVILESAREYVNSVHYLISFQLSYFTLLLRVVWRNVVVFLYQAIVIVLFLVIFGFEPHVVWLTVPLAMLVIMLNALWVSLLVSMFAARFRDISEVLNNIMRLVFFATPIIWMAELNQNLAVFAEWNPFYHLLEIFRGPIISGTVNLHSWFVCSCMLVGGWLIALPLFARFRARISFWL